MTIISSPTIVCSGGGTELNIAYGQTAPSDTSKIWIKAEEPESLEIKPFISISADPYVSTLTTSGGTLDLSRPGCTVGSDIYYLEKSSTSSATNTLKKYSTVENTIYTIGTFSTPKNNDYISGLYYLDQENKFYGLVNVSGAALYRVFSLVVNSNQITYTEEFTTSITQSETGNIRVPLPAIYFDNCLYTKFANGIIKSDLINKTSEFYRKSNSDYDFEYAYGGCIVGNYIYYFNFGSSKICRFNLISNTIDTSLSFISEDKSYTDVANPCGCVYYGGCVYFYAIMYNSSKSDTGIYKLDLSTMTCNKLSNISLSQIGYLYCYSDIIDNTIYVLHRRYHSSYWYCSGTFEKIQLNSNLESGTGILVSTSGDGISKGHLLNTPEIKQEVNSLKYMYGDDGNKAKHASVYYHNGTNWVQFT